MAIFEAPSSWSREVKRNMGKLMANVRNSLYRVLETKKLNSFASLLSTCKVGVLMVEH